MTTIRARVRIPILVLGVALGAMAIPAGCAVRSDETLGIELGGVAPPRFGGEAGSDGCNGETACQDANAFRPLCKATTCPAPYATCSNDAFRCETNFDSDNDNCGACGVACPQGEDVRTLFGAEWFCQSGECRMMCDPVFGLADCNNQVADGCESDVMCDSNNCGACGVKCPAGVSCRKGQCGCPSGFTACEDSCVAGCVNLKNSDNSCGACGKACPQADTPPFPNTKLGCVDAECGKLKCEEGFRDCNDDIEADGCEANLYEDPQNCGTCGKKCASGQSCIDGKCKCAPSETACPWPGGGGLMVCVDLDTNPFNCGVCGRACPSPPHQSVVPVCRFGRCELECPSGYADCDGRLENGCETSIAADPRNCGACGVLCDLALGQPCVGGACLLAPCNGGGTQ